ncbi:MAG: hypothetical protein ACI9MR_000052 [Myxococcota bacterium]|jgi:hypothetical protein
MFPASLTTTYENLIQTYRFEGTGTAPAGLYLAAFTSDPGETTNATELTGDGYARLDVSTLLTWTAQQLKLSADALFAAASADWSSVSHVALCASITGGTADIILRADLPTPRVITSGGQLKITSADFVFEFSTTAGLFDEGADLSGQFLFQAATAISAPTAHTAWYQAVWTSACGDDESGAEVETRVQLTGATALSVATNSATWAGDVVWSSMSVDRSLTHTSIHSASTGTGNGICWFALDSTATLLAGDDYTFPTSGSSIGQS